MLPTQNRKINLSQFFLLFFIVISTTLFAQTPISSLAHNDKDTTPGDLLIEQLVAWSQEKIYIQTDKPAYLSGERIWLRTHLVDATTHQPAYLSRYVYAELVTPMDAIEKRIMMRPDSTGAYTGYIDLDDDLTEGTYTLRAYTNYMRNNGTDALVRKSVEVLNPFSLQFEPRITFDVNKSRVHAQIQFVDRQNNEIVIPEVVTCNRAYRQGLTLKADDEGIFHWKPNMRGTPENRTMLLSALWNGRIYKRYYTIPYDPTQFHVDFFPEGGYLIPGIVNQVGFKAIGTDGLGRTLSGTIYNNNDDEVAHFDTWKNGMGFLNFFVQPNHTYYAICKTPDNSSQRFNLPVPQPDAVALTVKMQGRRIFAGLLGADNQTTPLTLLLHQRGYPLFQEVIDPGTSSISFPADNYPFGILSLLLIDENNNILSERMVFNTTENRLLDISLTGDTAIYRRSHAQLNFQLQGDTTQTLSGNFALSITDQNSVPDDSATHILSHLLLSSELRGHIESPADYFNGDAIDKNAIDALLMTQGWRRYDLPTLLKGKIQTPDDYPAEQSQQITGTATGFTRLKDAEVSLIATLDSMVGTTTARTDERGRFTLQFEYPEGTTLMVQSLTRRGSKLNTINLNPIQFPDTLGASLTLPAPYFTHHALSNDPYMQHAEEAYVHQFGMRHILLDEFTVEAKRVEDQKYKQSSFYTPLSATGVTTHEEILEMGLTSFRSLLYRQPGIRVHLDKITTTRSQQPVLFVIDNMQYTDFFDDIDMIDVNAIESIFVVRDNTSMPGYFPETEGAVVIHTKLGGFDRPRRRRPNLDALKPLGYQQPAEFYMPRYETDDERDTAPVDLRTTILWQPNLVFSTEGRAETSFYSADIPTTYSVLLEGVTDSGIPVRSQHTVTVQPTSHR